MENRISEAIMQSVNVKNDILKDSHFLKTIEDAKNAIVSAYRTGHKVLFAGNGGSAADAQHLAAELSGRFYLDRRSRCSPTPCSQGSKKAPVPQKHKGKSRSFVRII